MQIVFTKYKVINGRHGVHFFKRLLFATFSDSPCKERRPLGGLNCNLREFLRKKNTLNFLPILPLSRLQKYSTKSLVPHPTQSLSYPLIPCQGLSFLANTIKSAKFLLPSF